MNVRSTVALALALAIAALAGACGGDESASTDPTKKDSSLAGIERQPTPDVSTVTLPDVSANGQPFTTIADDGELLLVYFGYTNCPDVCPTTLADVRRARRLLGDDADRVDLAMVTIDPARDTSEMFPGYVQTFVPGAQALRTSDATKLRAAADAFGADYSVEQKSDGEIDVSHTAYLYAVDDTGKLVLQWPFGISSDDLAHDLATLLDRQSAETN
jgi:protein SCO1/2